MHELDSITIQGFKSIASLKDLKLEPINLLIGPNGSGKSNFVGAFSFLNAIREGRLQEYVSKAGGADSLLHFGSKATARIHIHIAFGGGVNQYSITLTPTQADRLFPSEEVAFYWNKAAYDRPYAEHLSPRGDEARISDPTARGIPDYVRGHLASWRLYHFHDTSASSPMKKTTDINDNRHLRSDASNLAAFLYFLKQEHKESYGLIRRTVQRVAPFFDDFQLEPQRLNPEKIRLEWRHRGSDAYFDAASFSDGTLRFIALSTLFLQPDLYRPSVIVVDEPELGLHPYAIEMVASLVQQAAEETQVILSTQSSLLLDHFRPEDVLVADRVEGETHLRRLESSPLKQWLEEYSLGQLWEKNEFGGRPSKE